MASSKYNPLGQEASEDLREHEAQWSEKASLTRARKTVYILLVLLTIAITFNIVLFIQIRNVHALLDTQSYGTSQRRNIP